MDPRYRKSLLPFNPALTARRTSHRGFTLLELMVVMVILAVLAGGVTVLVVRRVSQARSERARSDVLNLSNALEQYRLDNQDYPSSEQGLEALVTKPGGTPEPPNWTGRYIKVMPRDPWGRAYRYQSPGTQNVDAFDLFTLGKDDREGGTDENADINNWTEAQKP